jgi:hypothetical protein
VSMLLADQGLMFPGWQELQTIVAEGREHTVARYFFSGFLAK